MNFVQRTKFAWKSNPFKLYSSLNIKEIPNLKSFMKQSEKQDEVDIRVPLIPYLKDTEIVQENKKRVYVETYGCQMNSNDTEIVLGILSKYNYVKETEIDSADVVLLMTCSIRENAENKIWARLANIKNLIKRNAKVGILGCMAERLKQKVIEKEKLVDVVCGPDSYRDLPRLLSTAEMTGESAINVMLSMDETYADVLPVRYNENSKTAYISIMRGCDNMCSYCIVPFTRGKERSRPIESILNESIHLRDAGIKELYLLGQNVNSYRDLDQNLEASTSNTKDAPSKGFKTIYKQKEGGTRFADLIKRTAELNPNVRIRFTSPHPKDFPDDLLYAIRDYPNICKNIHLPAQSGSNTVLERMRRGYTRESYLELVNHIRSIIPNVTFSSDFISGFCGETEEEHLDTVDLIQRVQYSKIFHYAYSLREKTHAHRKYQDDVPTEVKFKRTRQIQDVYLNLAYETIKQYIGSEQIVMVNRDSQKSSDYWAGNTDGNITAIFKKDEMPEIKEGDFIKVLVESTHCQTLICHPLEKLATLK